MVTQASDNEAPHGGTRNPPAQIIKEYKQYSIRNHYVSKSKKSKIITESNVKSIFNYHKNNFYNGG